jgi:glycine betaine/proline transport system substrate-binding protein
MSFTKLMTATAALLLFTVGGAVSILSRKGSFSDVGWTDITSTTGATSAVLRGLGYEPEVDVLAVPVTIRA